MTTWQPQTGLAAINGAQLYYEVGGAGHPLLLLHAGIADSRMWDAQVEVFAAHYRVIRCDLRGFGRSNMPPGRFAYHEDVRALLDFLAVDRAYLIGISFGGLIALDFALAHPQRVSALILGAPSVSGDTPSERIRQFWADEDAALEQGDLAGATELNLRLWVDGPQRTPEQVDPAVRAKVYQMQLDAFRQPEPDDVETDDLDPPASERLAEVGVPTLLLVGDLDLPEKLALTERLAAEIPAARRVIIPAAAHMLNMEQPEQFNREVLAFLDRLT